MLSTLVCFILLFAGSFITLDANGEREEEEKEKRPAKRRWEKMAEKEQKTWCVQKALQEEGKENEKGKSCTWIFSSVFV